MVLSTPSNYEADVDAEASNRIAQPVQDASRNPQGASFLDGTS
jgi:hypothetical protein